MILDTKNFEIPFKPSGDEAMIYVVRPSVIGGFVKFNVFVNSKEKQNEVGYTRAKEYVYFYLKPGDYEIFSKAENWASTKISLKKGEVAFIKQIPTIGFILARNKLEIIDEQEAKHSIKNGKIGRIIKLKPLTNDIF